MNLVVSCKSHQNMKGKMKMQKILMVEDDANLALGIEYALKNEGFQVAAAGNLAKARELSAEDDFDLILLDIMLPDGTGYDFCRETREKTSIPVIFLTACDEEVNIVMGLDMGGDDYITKPFRIRELVSRIKAVLRRNSANKDDNGGKVLCSGSLQLHVLEGKARKNGTDIFLTSMEYKLLLTLVSHPRQVLGRSSLLEGLWDIDGEFVDDNALSVYIRRLREKIEDSPDKPEYICTVRGVGYKWDADVRRMGI